MSDEETRDLGAVRRIDAQRKRRAELLREEDLPLPFGRYMLQSVLGEGGMARVFRAELLGPAGFRKVVALKVIKSGSFGDLQSEEALGLMREACVAGRLKHPNLVDTYDFGVVDGQPFICMELIEGLTLTELLHTEGALPPSILLQIALAVTSGLERLHAQGRFSSFVPSVHCDLKPSNILLSWEGEVKIADFGLAQDWGLDELAAESMVSQVRGTPSFMAPEQLAGKSPTLASDLFSLGLILACMALGKHPIGSRVLMERVQRGEPLESELLSGTADSELRRSLPGLAQIVSRCLQRDPGDRWSSVTTLSDALRDLQDRVGMKPRLARWMNLGTGEASEGSLGTAPPLSDDQTGTIALPWSPPSLGFEPPQDGFVGREAELESLSAALQERRRLVVLTGPGGAGKTRLAMHWLRSKSAALPGGSWMADLTYARSQLDMLQTVASALRVSLQADAREEDILQRLSLALRARGACVLFLDNYEQLVKTALTPLSTWLRQAPELFLLVTSRQPLRLPGEQVLEVGPLGEEGGMQLLRERAASSGAPWTEDRQSEPLRALVRELDGLPLALELAAARARLLTPQQLLERMRQRFQLLRRQGSGGRQERHATLRGTLDWSWSLLEPWERAALAQLSVFKGGFTMEAAEEVVDLSGFPEAPWAMDVIGSLLDQSLLVSRPSQAQPRFGMLLSVLAYAQEMLRSLEAEGIPGTSHSSLRRRHRSYFARFGDPNFLMSLFTHGGEARRRVMNLELDNLYEAGQVESGLSEEQLDDAAACSLAAAEIIDQIGPYSKSLSLMQALLSQALSPLSRCQLLLCCSRIQRHLVSAETSMHLAEEALRLARACRSPSLEVRALSELSSWYWAEGRAREAIEGDEEALRLAQRTGDRVQEGIVLGNLATSLKISDDDGRCQALYHQALLIHRELGNPLFESITLGQLGVHARQAGRYQEAEERYHQAMAIARRLGDRQEEMRLLTNLGNLLRQRGDLRGSAAHHQACIALAERMGDRVVLLSAHNGLGNTLKELERYEESERSLRRTIELARELANQGIELLGMGNLGALLSELGRHEEAEELLRRVLELEGGRHPHYRAYACATLGRLMARRGDFTEGQVYLAEALEHGFPRRPSQRFSLYCTLTEVLLGEGRIAEAQERLEEARALQRELNLPLSSANGQHIQQLAQQLRRLGEQEGPDERAGS